MQTTLIVKAATGFCKGKKIRICRGKKQKIRKVQVVHKIHGPFTGVSWFISRLCPLKTSGKTKQTNQASSAVSQVATN
jgi:hypothetical protein